MRSPKTKTPGGNRASKAHNNSANHDTTAPIDRLLSRLDGVRQAAPDRWIARCPAHEDRTPSLSIRETGDGTVLLRCWAGCGATDVVAGAGLELRDLFPQRLDHHHSPIRQGSRWSPRDLLALLRREAVVVLVAARDVHAGVALPGDDHARLGAAVTRIAQVADEVAPMPGPSDDDLATVARRHWGAA